MHVLQQKVEITDKSFRCGVLDCCYGIVSYFAIYNDTISGKKSSLTMSEEHGILV